MPSSFNQVILMGNLGQDPHVLKTTEQGSYVRCSIATNKKWKDKQSGELKEKTHWNTVYFNHSLGTAVANYARKGDKLLVRGELQSRSWTDEVGVKHFETSVLAHELQFLTYKAQEHAQSTPPTEEMENDVPALTETSTMESNEMSEI